jgi:hypothetical protein
MIAKKIYALSSFTVVLRGVKLSMECTNMQIFVPNVIPADGRIVPNGVMIMKRALVCIPKLLHV